MNEDNYSKSRIIGSLTEEELEEILEDIDSEHLRKDIRKSYEKYL